MESIDLSKLANLSNEVPLMISELEGASEKGVPSYRSAAGFTPASGEAGSALLWPTRFIPAASKNAPRR